MFRKPFRLGGALSLSGIVAASPLLAACGGPSYEDWAATDGAAGRINLDDVQEAFKSPRASPTSSAASTKSTKATAWC